jgi:hypothetical protein
MAGAAGVLAAPAATGATNPEATATAASVAALQIRR